jgi:uncharacterized protein YjbJ (UPF0337 family)
MRFSVNRLNLHGQFPRARSNEVTAQQARQHNLFEENNPMKGQIDKIKGRVEEAAGVLTNDRRLKNRGKIDQAAGTAKDVIGKVIDKATGAAKRIGKK